jgi:hypothetical protein
MLNAAKNVYLYVMYTYACNKKYVLLVCQYVLLILASLLLELLVRTQNFITM